MNKTGGSGRLERMMPMASTERIAVSSAQMLLGRLREKLRAAERAAGLNECSHSLALNIPEIDAVLGGGLVCGALHEVAAAREADMAATTGFALSLSTCSGSTHSHQNDRHATTWPQAQPSLLRPRSLRERAAPKHQHVQMGEGSWQDTPHPSFLADPRRLPSPARGEGAATTAPTRGCNLPEARATAIVWIAEDLSLAEHGAPYGLGLDAAGLPPERLIAVQAARSRDVLWAMEEALRCRAAGIVIGELRAREIAPVATRRLSLAAATGNALGLLLRPAPGEETSAAVTRWLIAAAPSCSERGGSVGPPRLIAQLMRNRRGALGAWIVEWNRTELRYGLTSANPQPLAQPPLDRSHPAAVA